MKKVLSMIGLAVLSGCLLRADSSKISPELLSSNASGKIRVIVQYNRPPSGASLLNIPLLGGLVAQTLSTLNALIVSLPVSSLQALSNMAEVSYISPDRPVKQALDYSASAVNAGAAWNSKLTGLGVGVAVIDSGVAQLPDLTMLGLPRVVYHQDFTGGTPTLLGLLSAPKDGYGHGTHVAGIIGANGMASSCFNCTRVLKGIAPNASIIDLKVLDGNGAGSDSEVLAAIDRAISLKSLLNIRVINLSLGRPVWETYQKDPLCQAVEAAWKAGIVVVVAAGNEGRDNSVGNQGYGTIQSPANDPYVITVGAMKAMGTYTRTDDLIASYSSKGPSAIDFVVKPDVVAPGNHVVSLESPNSTLAADPLTTVPYSYYQATMNGNDSPAYMVLNGTSMATPVVSGAVADLLEGQPSLTPDSVKARLMKTAYKTFPTSSTAVDPVSGESFTSYYDIFTIGAGYLDIAAMLQNHDTISGNAMSPTAAFDAATQSVYLTFYPGSVWNGTDMTTSGSRAVWSTQSVWGASVVGANRAVWGTRAVWSTSTTDGFRAVWSTRGVWGTSVDEGTRAVWGTDSHTSDSDSVFSVNH